MMIPYLAKWYKSLFYTNGIYLSNMFLNNFSYSFFRRIRGQIIIRPLIHTDSAEHLPQSKLAAPETSAFRLAVAVGMSTGNADVLCRTFLGFVEVALYSFTQYIRVLLCFSYLVGATAATLRCKASTACLRWCSGLGSFHMDVFSLAAIVLIVGTVYHITI